ncbi:hypothetical protein LAD12857_01900 [Lacrimispora amygdalina]|uniref:DUF4367 domain-containing protein n=1 Tax=Lacrimispora amygdalina TaxID=253257 RepID=A0A3E2NGT8_9FIRM|nr:hypothetical protein [Clostridium indicum]RFZ80219.1 hypothetical protein DS742_04450 [Clostridium indicum]
MARTSENDFKRFIKAELDLITPDMDEERRLLEIHKKLSKRSNCMKFRRNKLTAAFTAMVIITVLGTVTAVAAGKITSFVSGTDKNVNTLTELRELSKDQMKASPKFPDKFTNGMAFVKGNISHVKGMDEDNNQVITYSEAYADYGENSQVVLSCHVHQDTISAENQPGQKEVYQGVELNSAEMQYVFLPEGQEPSEEDKKLQEEGKMMISYGSDQEERKMLKSVNWSENGIDYLLFTFENVELNSMTSMAKEVIDMK